MEKQQKGPLKGPFFIANQLQVCHTMVLPYRRKPWITL